MPGEMIVNSISIPIDGIEKVLLRVIWQEVVTDASTGREIGDDD